jgi:hypothetical protein
VQGGAWLPGSIQCILCVDGAAGGCEGVQRGAWLPGTGQAPICEFVTRHPRRLQEEARVQSYKSRKPSKYLLIVDSMIPTVERYILQDIIHKRSINDGKSTLLQLWHPFLVIDVFFFFSMIQSLFE